VATSVCDGKETSKKSDDQAELERV